MRFTRPASHVVWTLDPCEGWTTEGALQTERQAVADARALKVLGMPAMALPLGKEPEQLHPADRPVRVTA